jgi:hypothetical protein
MGGVSAEVEVIGYKPVIDTTSSSFSTSLGEDSIQNLPVGRSYQDAVNMLPGVYGRVDTDAGGPGDGNPSVRGEGQYGNNFMVDGVSTRDPATKYPGASVNFDAIQEIQAYTDGAPAEYGQFTGMMVNVVTKDGGDEHHGSIAAFYAQHAWFDSEYDIYDPDEHKEIPTTKQKDWNPVLDATAGGPLIKEKLWYFTAVGLRYDSFRPEGLDEKLDPLLTYGGNFMGKVTWFPSTQWTLRYIYSNRLSIGKKFDAGPIVSDEATSNSRVFEQSHRINATWTPDDKNTLELRLGMINRASDSVPSLGDSSIPSRTNGSGVLLDNANDEDLNDRNRLGGSIEFTRYLEHVLGDHRFKAGADAWLLIDQREIINQGETTIDWLVDENGDGVPEVDGQKAVGTHYYGQGDEFPCVEPDYSDCYSQEHWTNVGPLANKVKTYSAFLQDDWQPIKQLTANLGVRVDIEDFKNDVGDRIPTQKASDAGKPEEERSKPGELGPQFMPAPRLGLVLDPWADGKTKVSAFYGQFYDIEGSGLWEWSNTKSANGFVRSINDGTGNFVWSNTQDPAGTPLIYEEGIKPGRMDKANVAIEREIAKDLSIGIRGILSQTINMPEDVDVNLNDWYIMSLPERKQRNYRALEFTLQKQWDEVWQVYGAYTLQESYGHLPGQFELPLGADYGGDGNNVGVYLDDIGDRATRQSYYDAGAGWLVEGFKGLGRYSPAEPEYYDEAGWFGYLPYNSFHAIKLNGSYTAPFGTTFGLVYEFDSGHSWEKTTSVPFYGYNGFGQGRGSRVMPAVHYVDGRIAHEIGLGKEDRSLEATLDIFNIPGFAQAITYWPVDEDGFGSTVFRQAPRSVRLGVKMRY